MYSIEHLNIITSSFCDLKCSYCFLHKNRSFRQYDKWIIESWKDGTYVQNIKKVFEKLNCNPKEVTDLSFWGGEPFIHINKIIDGMIELIKFCPDIQSIVVPTNWVHTNISDLCQLLQVINDNITPRKEDNPLHFHVQMSIDGIEGDVFIKDGHTASWKQYHRNCYELYEQLEEMYLPNISVHFCVSSTGTQENFLTHFSNLNNIKKHINFWDKEIRQLIETTKDAKNPSIFVNSMINFPTIATPQETSSTEGMEIVKLIKTIEQTLYTENAFRRTNDQVMRLFYNHELDWPLCKSNHECPEASQRAVTIIPDGTICQCPDGWIEHTKKFQNEFLEEKDYKKYKKMLIASHQFYNPLTATEKETADHRWYDIMGGFKDTYFPYISLGYAMCQELALSHQLDEIYLKSPELLYIHFISSGMINECFKTSCQVTSFPYLSGQDIIRRWLNGYSQTAYNYHLEDLKWTIKESISDKIQRLEE